MPTVENEGQSIAVEVVEGTWIYPYWDHCGNTGWHHAREIELPKVENEGQLVVEVRSLLTVWQTLAFNFGTHQSIRRVSTSRNFSFNKHVAFD